MAPSASSVAEITHCPPSTRLGPEAVGEQVEVPHAVQKRQDRRVLADGAGE